MREPHRAAVVIEFCGTISTWFDWILWDAAQRFPEVTPQSVSGDLANYLAIRETPSRFELFYGRFCELLAQPAAQEEKVDGHLPLAY